MIFSTLISLALLASMEADLGRVSAHLKVGDTAASLAEARRVVANHPTTPKSYEMMIKALAASGQTAQMMRFWESFLAKFPKEAMERGVLEELCWAHLAEGKRANTLSTKLIGIIGAALTQDAYAVDFLLAGLRDSNAHIRALSVQLAALFRDAPLQQEIIRLFHTEKNREVKVEVIKAIAELGLKQLQPELLEIVEAKRSSSAEKAAAISALCQMSEGLGLSRLKQLATDKRAGLRLLACEAIAKFSLKESADLLALLCNDPIPEVAAAALRTIGVLGLTKCGSYDVVDLVLPLTKTADPLVGITASWVLLLHDQKAAEKAYAHWIFHEQDSVRALASASIGAAGKYGVMTALMFLEKTKDPYVEANLAIGLIGQRAECELACEILSRLLLNSEERWMKEETIFPLLQKSNLSHKPQIPNYPEVVNQTIRLEMINLLAILHYPKAQQAIHNFLKERRYGVTGLAAQMLLGEGDESATQYVKELLDDPDKEIRLDAALVLATWGHDSAATPVLLQLYPEADRIMKIKILESLGQIADVSVIPFLIERLKEPSLNMRLIAASVLIQTLNH